ncbi:hypothetical protein QC762_100145 [Podospora pseudocomata]|uniref:DUF7918 domain-containing protein n=1 Tax=Podospora pseudocomata TaxID=2093779 RepID=A0ABR0GRM6_9PEZI|nr:hypothetical protein QC762_100145 [Podospora pseudocomata]
MLINMLWDKGLNRHLPFTFGNLDVGTKKTKKYGTFIVELFNHIGTIESRKKNRFEGPTAISSLPSETIPQQAATKALDGKALNCRATFQPVLSRLRTSITLRDGAMMDPWERPFARYEFPYRLKDGLIKKGIIPEPSLEEQVAQMSDEKRKEALLKALKREKEQEEEIETLATSRQSSERGTRVTTIPRMTHADARRTNTRGPGECPAQRF